jgi:hypothetical protein
MLKKALGSNEKAFSLTKTTERLLSRKKCKELEVYRDTEAFGMLCD